MLGAGWNEATIERGLELGIDVITVDAGSTDSGPYYLGSATPKTTAKAVARDLRSLLRAAARADVPLIVGSCGTSGTDAGVDWVCAFDYLPIVGDPADAPHAAGRMIDLCGRIRALG